MNSSEVEEPEIIEGTVSEFQIEEIDSVIKNIHDNFFRNLKFTDETDFENHLFSYLHSVYGKQGWIVERQVPCGNSQDKIDIVLQKQDFKMVIELKIGRNKTYIRNSFGQLYTHAKNFPNTVLIILDVSEIDESYYSNFRNDLQKFGVYMLVPVEALERRELEQKQLLLNFYNIFFSTDTYFMFNLNPTR